MHQLVPTATWSTLPARPSTTALPRSGPRSIAHLGTFPPTQCGLATFGAALVASLGTVSPSTRLGVIDVVERARRRDQRVGVQLVGGSTASASAAVSFANDHDALVVEHEFGIYAGRDGESVLDVLGGVTCPLLTVLHTVLGEPTVRQRAIIEQLAVMSDAVIVMSGAASTRLLGAYAVDPATVHIVPHGAHPNTPRLGERRRGDRPVVLTWGLLGPGKGIEAGIDAMAGLRDIIPVPRYVVAGETHPKVLAAAGEQYRESLRRRSVSMGVDDMVEFDGSYRDVESLNLLVRGADVVLLPYETREQVTSGVLIEAVASERPVVATDFPHARELLAGGAGIVVPHDDPAAVARALRLALCDPRLAASMRAAARRAAAGALWPAVARRYLDIAAQCVLHRSETGQAGRVA
jgi:glycosyltransferase involved in cell wall biosynthesis